MNQKAFDIEEAISAHPLFERASLKLGKKLASTAKFISLSDGQVLFTPGEKALGGYIVLSGIIRLFIEQAEGEFQTLRFVNAGDTFAEPMMFGEDVYPVGAEAIGGTTVLLISQVTLAGELKEDAELAMSLLRSLAVRLKYHVQTIRMLTIPDPLLRMLLYLQENVQSSQPVDGEWCAIKPSLMRKDLASRLNIAPETVSRLCKNLVNSRVVTLKNHRIDKVHLRRIDKLFIEQLKKGTRSRRSTAPS